MMGSKIIIEYTSINRAFGLLYFIGKLLRANLVLKLKTKRHESTTLLSIDAGRRRAQ